jgi:hypothetical protein
VAGGGPARAPPHLAAAPDVLLAEPIVYTLDEVTLLPYERRVLVK